MGDLQCLAPGPLFHFESLVSPLLWLVSAIISPSLICSPVSSSYKNACDYTGPIWLMQAYIHFKVFHYTYKVSLYIFLFCTCKISIHKLWELGHRCLWEDCYSIILSQ